MTIRPPGTGPGAASRGGAGLEAYASYDLPPELPGLPARGDAEVEDLGSYDEDDEPLEGTATNTRFAMPAMGEPGTLLGPAGSARARELDAARRSPAPAGRRPTLFGLEGDGGALANPKTVRPGVMDPVRPRSDSDHRDVGAGREGSDVIQTFHSGDGAEPQPMVAPPSERLRGRLERKPPRPVAGAAARPALAAAQPPPPLMTAAASSLSRPAPASHPALAANVAATPSTLPLDEDRLAALIADQRRQLHMLDAWARALEVGAGVLGSVSLAIAVVALVATLLATTPSLLAGAAALVGAAVGLGLSLLLVVFAVLLRQLAHMAAQQAALLEALCR